ncbi:FKBP-type peptidyl-prolyl cis-trans isomerase [Enterobacter sp. Lyrl_3]|uniref:FKBP-type peptidyl-prolyl cis-trans isomerase n=1 Tax=Enterobacter sp. Lyrl_3 TaxID=3110922 RepID=UPI003F801887
MNSLTRFCGHPDVAGKAVRAGSGHPGGVMVRLLVCAALAVPALSVQAATSVTGADAPAPDAAEVLALRQELARQDALLQKLMSQQADLLSQHKQPSGGEAVPAHPSGVAGEAASGTSTRVAPGGQPAGQPQEAEKLPLTAATVAPPPAVQQPATGITSEPGAVPAASPAAASSPPATTQAPESEPAPASASAAPDSPSVSGATPAPGAQPLSLQDDNARRAYASGVSLAYEMQQSLAVQKSLGISLPRDVLMAGLQDALSNHPLRMQDRDIQSTLASLNADFTNRMQSRRADEVARGREFRADFRRKKGAFSDAGSLYLIDEKGTGRLHTSDMASLLVTGRLPDGTVFDGSGQAGQARKVRVSAMLPAIAIGLQKIGVGGHITIVVPPEKGYGDMGLPPTVPGGATLIFDITVQGVNEGG